MANYIDKAALVGEVLTSGENQLRFRQMTGEEAYFEALRLVGDMPTADVKPVRHGRWDDSGEYIFPDGSKAIVCTECGCALTPDEYQLNRWNYCPVCGARCDLGGADNGE